MEEIKRAKCDVGEYQLYGSTNGVYLKFLFLGDQSHGMHGKVQSFRGGVNARRCNSNMINERSIGEQEFLNLFGKKWNFYSISK